MEEERVRGWKAGPEKWASTSGGEEGDIMIEDEQNTWILSKKYVVNSCGGIGGCVFFFKST
jgi:hypothetical protein